MPWAVVAEELATTHPYKVLALRAMIAVPYFEKALYELADDELTEWPEPRSGSFFFRLRSKRAPAFRVGELLTVAPTPMLAAVAKKYGQSEEEARADRKRRAERSPWLGDGTATASPPTSPRKASKEWQAFGRGWSEGKERCACM